MDNFEPKKISFGFSKLSKKTNLLVKQQPVEEKKIDIIEYLEEKSIKVVGGDDDKPKSPLVIPMKQPNKKLINLVEIVKNDFREPDPEINNEPKVENGKIEDQNLPENLTLEEQAARELLNASNNVQVKEENKRVIDVSTKNTEKITFEGEKESTIDDYEDIPIDEFGKAMLRGMGWKDGHGIGKNEQLVKVSQPMQRPKGMGLGADKMTKQDKNEKPAVDRDGNALKCVKGAFVKIIAGYHKGNYGQIIGLDDESGRFIIKTALNNLNVSLNEFLVIPVTKEEYTKNSKVINNARYEEYMKKKALEEQIKLKETSIKKERDSDFSEEEKSIIRKEDKYDKKGKNYDRNDSEEDRRKKEKHEKPIKKERKASESDLEEDRNRKKEKNNKEIKKERRSNSEEKYSRKERIDKRSVKKERRSSESDYEDRRNRKDKYEKSSKYNSEDYKKEESRDRKNRDKKKQSNSKSKHYSSESEKESERRKSKKKSSKYDSDSEDNEQGSSKKKHKKKKSRKHSSDDSDEEKYKRKSKKSDRKKYDDSDSEYEEKYKKSQKRDKHHDKRDRSRHDKERK